MTTMAVFAAIIGMQTRSLAQADKAWPVESRTEFKTLDDLKVAFRSHDVPIKVDQGKVSTTKYVVVAAFPYSGMNSIDVYFYRETYHGLRLYSLTYLTNSKDEKIIVRQNQGSVEIIHNGAIALTFTFPNSLSDATTKAAGQAVGR